MEIHDLPAGDPRWEQALPVLQQLRPRLTRHDLATVFAAPDGVRPTFFGAFDGDVCLGVGSWRLIVNTSAGRKLYVDDLVTDDDVRSRGVGSALLAHAEEIALGLDCVRLDLDSGVQRHAAHRFYLRERMIIQAFHFTKHLSDGVDES
ncbi:MAG TPA: GNAT family N-acetyltransferase [Actinomycetaceae bacterium]|nr:GNAT family N-acetyltransferase [Actinomycetaceae bacterium]